MIKLKELKFKCDRCGNEADTFEDLQKCFQQHMENKCFHKEFRYGIVNRHLSKSCKNCNTLIHSIDFEGLSQDSLCAMYKAIVENEKE